ncbi:STAS domain-containing protein [Rossellomorea sp. KS-H15a]|uniref:STAS domain-containing protein n=1 Tax=Rossellomorea sp. KS-H15a TaxID=2963940 RepID=UPI0020C5D84E|nr:STAS domain-containing protein [Rossellomorea sp. KS-H15a]UTE79342.1 STAS domain-containing protein [Rossellomorea sp. KS-H15a]
MSYKSLDKEIVTDFLKANREDFQQKLLSEAVNVRGKISDILEKGNIDLLKNAELVAHYIVEDKEEELIAFAKIEGIAWAQHDLTLAFKLEWVHAIRRALWYFLYQFDEQDGEDESPRKSFFDLEKRINDNVDQFLNNFFISYSDYKDEQLWSHRKLVENLSVPIIPVNSTIAVLPLIGMIDSYRVHALEEKVLMEISSMKIQTLIIDLSGTAEMEMDVLFQFERILSGINMMGCKAVLTGLRVELVRNIVDSGVEFDSLVEIKGTLQQTLKGYL